jgi:uncharacterized peroxidase-related enzyme
VRATGDEALVRAVLDDYRAAPIDERLRAALAFVEKLTVAPESVSAADIAPLRAAGLSDRAIEEAIYVTFLFSTIARIADAFGFELNSARGLSRVALILTGSGYKRASVPG